MTWGSQVLKAGEAGPRGAASAKPLLHKPPSNDYRKILIYRKSYMGDEGSVAKVP